jgi:hypothetical protein
MKQALQDWRNHHRVKAVRGFLRREWPVVAFALQFIALALVVLWINSIATVNHDSLCALKHNLEERIADTAEFLEDHPEGFAGIPAATLQQSADNQQSTVDALERGGLDCD